MSRTRKKERYDCASATTKALHQFEFELSRLGERGQSSSKRRKRVEESV
jgi:hypothetical protein